MSQQIWIVACKNCPEVLYKQAKVALDSLTGMDGGKMQTNSQVEHWNSSIWNHKNDRKFAPIIQILACLVYNKTKYESSCNYPKS